jgi:cytochrome c oxidase assembly protein subunit 15
VIGLGALTRLIDAGLGCPDWPGCYGHLTVPLPGEISGFPESHFVTYKAWAEMIHRYFAGTLSILILVIVILLFIRAIKQIKTEKFNLFLAIFILLAVIYQIILGQWTVTLKLLPIIVTQHLLGGFLIVSILWLIYLNNQSRQRLFVEPPLQGLNIYFIFIMIGFFLVLAQIMLGAWTSTNYASLSCPDFPFCVNSAPWMNMQFKQAFNIFSPVGINYEGGILPETMRQTIQMTHRLGALVVTLYMLIFTVLAAPKLKSSMYLMKSIYIIWGLLIIQVCIGMTNVIFKLPLITAVSHTLIAIMLLLAVLTLAYKLATYQRGK